MFVLERVVEVKTNELFYWMVLVILIYQADKSRQWKFKTLLGNTPNLSNHRHMVKIVHGHLHDTFKRPIEAFFVSYECH